MQFIQNKKRRKDDRASWLRYRTKADSGLPGTDPPGRALFSSTMVDISPRAQRYPADTRVQREPDASTTLLGVTMAGYEDVLERLGAMARGPSGQKLCARGVSGRNPGQVVGWRTAAQPAPAEPRREDEGPARALAWSMARLSAFHRVHACTGTCIWPCIKRRKGTSTWTYIQSASPGRPEPCVSPIEDWYYYIICRYYINLPRRSRAPRSSSSCSSAALRLQATSRNLELQ